MSGEGLRAHHGVLFLNADVKRSSGHVGRHAGAGNAYSTGREYSTPWMPEPYHSAEDTMPLNLQEMGAEHAPEMSSPEWDRRRGRSLDKVA
jgi:hypothetical protein